MKLQFVFVPKVEPHSLTYRSPLQGPFLVQLWTSSSTLHFLDHSVDAQWISTSV